MGIKSTRTVNVRTKASGTVALVSGTWPGGVYVDLAFGGYSAPIEVINVYNAETLTIDPRVHTPAGLKEIVREWITDTSADWPEWYSVYVEQYGF